MATENQKVHLLPLMWELGGPNAFTYYGRQALLVAPFERRSIKLKIQAFAKNKTRGLIAPYLDARDIMDRLDFVFPAAWSVHYDADAHACSILIDEATRKVTDVGGSDDYKTFMSDAFKRAAVHLGIGRYLYRLPKYYADLEGDERFKKIKDPDRCYEKLLIDKAAADGVSIPGIPGYRITSDFSLVGPQAQDVANNVLLQSS